MDYEDIPQFPYSGYEVDIGLNYLQKWLVLQNEGEPLDLNPDFQRGHVWTGEQRSRYVEYLLRGGEGGRVLCFNHPGWSGRHGRTKGPYQILDGLQRLTSLTMFLNNELPAFGRLRQEYTGYLSPGIKWRVFELQTRAEVLQYYLDMNAGGTQHEAKEIARVRALLRKEQP